MQYLTLFGHTLDIEPSVALAEFHARILASTPQQAEALLYGAENPLATSARLEGRVVWTADILRSVEFAFLADAVARARLVGGTLDKAAVEDACTWTLADAARSLGVSEQAIGAAVTSGDLPAVRKRGAVYLDPRTVESYSTRQTRPVTSRVPALYATTGVIGDASLEVCVLAGQVEHVSSVDDTDTLCWPVWTEAVIFWGRAGKARAIRVRPAHGRPVSRVQFHGLEAHGRWEVCESTNNRARAVEMLKAARGED